MPTLKNKEIENLLCREGERVVYVNNDPKIPTRPDVVQVAYVAKEDNTFDIWINTDVEEEPEDAWKRHLTNVKPRKSAAMAHYDEMRWKELQKTETKRRKTDTLPADQERLKRAVRYMYDLQKLRIQSGNRDSDQAEPAILEDENKEFFGHQSTGLDALEKIAEAEVLSILERIPIFTEYLKHQAGCGTKMSGVIISEIDIGFRRRDHFKETIAVLKKDLEETDPFDDNYGKIEKELKKYQERLKNFNPCDTVSSLWAYAGLAVDTSTGKAVKRVKGKKANWNSFLKTKMVFVLAESFIKQKGTWKAFYDDYKHRKANQIVENCMLCEGLGALRKKEVDGKSITVPSDPGEGARTCYNCNGKKHNVPWGKGKKHRDMAAKRYMIKMFLQELWLKWRELEGLPVTAPYAEAKLGIKHGDHAPNPEPEDDTSEKKPKKK